MINSFTPKIITTSANKFIHIYDNVIDYKNRIFYDNFVKDSLFKTTGKDGSLELHKHQVYSSYDEDDLSKMQFNKTRFFSFLTTKYNLKEKDLVQIRVNCSNCFERSVPHVDWKGVTVLYCCNLTWDVYGGGSTLFFNEDLSDIDYTMIFKPGRVVVFDGTIPHCVSPISVTCREFRYTLVLQFLDKPKII